MVRPNPPKGDVANELRFNCVTCKSSCEILFGSFCFVDLDGPLFETRYWCKPCAAKEMR